VNAPLRLAIVDDYAVVVAGVASLLAEERIEVVETAAGLPISTDVDVVLYDTFAQVDHRGVDLTDFVRDSGAKVVLYSWNLRPELIEQAIAEGSIGYLSKVLTGPAIVEALERIISGEIVILTGDHETSVGGAGDWPGRSVGLSPREAEVIALIARGLSNEEIAERAHVSGNSIKSYIRSAYRKIGIERRTHAVLWALANGFAPDFERTIVPALRLRPADPASIDLANQPERNHLLGSDVNLTPREREVLALIVAGLSNSDIAAELHLTPNTVKSFIRTGYAKIGVTTRAQAVGWGVEHGFPTARPGI